MFTPYEYINNDREYFSNFWQTFRLVDMSINTQFSDFHCIHPTGGTTFKHMGKNASPVTKSGLDRF